MRVCHSDWTLLRQAPTRKLNHLVKQINHMISIIYRVNHPLLLLLGMLMMRRPVPNSTHQLRRTVSCPPGMTYRKLLTQPERIAFLIRSSMSSEASTVKDTIAIIW